ncbi:MAG TPA: SRPBCC domain-containing protein, partial [Burkholderiales bacterium]|nr:SRPBCC domain-containing protein [Burkholderiales bacterium]
MAEQRIVEVVYIKAALADVWDALTNPEVTERYWFGTRIDSDWTVGSKVLYLRNGEVTDEHVVLAVDEPHSFSHTFKPLFGEFQAEAPSKVTVSLDENGGVVRLTVLHEDFPPD